MWVIRATINASDDAVPESPAAQAHLNIAQRLMGQEVPLIIFDAYASYGIFRWFKNLFSGR